MAVMVKLTKAQADALTVIRREGVAYAYDGSGITAATIRALEREGLVDVEWTVSERFVYRTKRRHYQSEWVARPRESEQEETAATTTERRHVTADQFADQLRHLGATVTVRAVEGQSYHVDAKRGTVSVRCLFTPGFDYAYRTDVDLDLTTKIRSMKAVTETLGLK